MSIKFVWEGEVNKPLYFKDVPVNKNFLIDTESAQGAVYRKVYNKDKNQYLAMEEATGNLYTPTNSPVKLVDATVSIKAPKPNLPGY